MLVLDYIEGGGVGVVYIYIYKELSLSLLLGVPYLGTMPSWNLMLVAGSDIDTDSSWTTSNGSYLGEVCTTSHCLFKWKKSSAEPLSGTKHWQQEIDLLN